MTKNHKNKIKILFYCGHPAQFLFFKNTIKHLIDAGNTPLLIIKKKDVLEDLVKNSKFEYKNIYNKTRGDSKTSIIISLIVRSFRMMKIVLKHKPTLLIGGDPSLAIAGKLLRIKHITVTEDDFDVIKSLAKVTYPITDTILCPNVCDVGKYEKKKVGYDGYMKLAYLGPNVFSPNTEIKKKYNLPDKYVIIRLSSLKAHHDIGIEGIDSAFLLEIIRNFEINGFTVLISDENNSENIEDKYKLKILPQDIHSVLYYSSILVCDSQSMSVEASILGVPSIRYSSFAGRISVLEELEHKYGLTYGIQPGNRKEFIEKLNMLLLNKNLKQDFNFRKESMLKDKIDVTSFLIWFLENFPESKRRMFQDNNPLN
jgi:predicted glycosyltransferase